MRRMSLIGSLVLLAGLVFTGVARASTQPTVSAPTTYHVVKDVRITMQSDGTSLDSDQYIPDTGCPCPVILIQTPYRKSGSVAEANPYFPAHGYGEIVVDVRGTGSSEGYWDSFGAKEQHDGAELVNYAAHVPFGNGVVGLAGTSYGAINQFLTVEQPGTSAVKAIFPVVPMSDAYRDVTWAGGNIDSGFIPLWLGLVTGLAAVPADDTQSNPQIALNAESQHLLDVAKFQAPVVGDSMLGYYEANLPGDAQQYPDAAYAGPFSNLRSPLRNISLVHQPTFIVGGLYDIFQRGEPLLYQGLSLPTSKKKLLIGPWYHTTAGNGLGTPAAIDNQGRQIPDLNTLQLAWFDHFLKGYDNGVTAFPDETYFQGVNKFIAGQYPWGSTPQKWFLGAAPSGSGAQSLYDGALGTSGPSRATAGSASLPWTAANGLCSRNTVQWTAGLANNGSCETDESPNEYQAATFTSPAFSSPYAVNGPIDLHLFVQSQRPDSSLIATVTDVSPSGASDPITSGTLVLSERALTTTACGAIVVDCTEYAGGLPIIPWHPYTRAAQSPLQPGTTYAVDVEIFPTSIVVPKGDRLRISLTSSDLPHESPTLSTTADSVGNVLTILFGPATPSYVYLETFKPNF